MRLEKNNNLSRDVYRVLQLFERLNQGEILSKQKLSEEYSVADKTIQRDIHDLKEYFRSVHGKDDDVIEYRRDKKGFVLREHLWRYQSKQQIFSMAKVLLESRVFDQQEMSSMLDGLVYSLAPKDRPAMQKLFRNELLHYKQPHQRPLFDLVWQLSEYILRQNVLQVSYDLRFGSNADFLIAPAAVLFSENHFFLVAVELKREGDKLAAVYSDQNEPSILRLDQIMEITPLQEQFAIPYSSQYEDVVIRRRVKLFHENSRTIVRFRYWGTDLTKIVLLFPDTQVLSTGEDGSYIIQISLPKESVKPILFLSLDTLEVLEPASLREEMLETAAKIVSIYNKNI